MVSDTDCFFRSSAVGVPGEAAPRDGDTVPGRVRAPGRGRDRSAMGEAERGEAAPRQSIDYFCSSGHRTLIAFAVEAVVPESWDCPRCGMPASMDADNPPPVPKNEPYKTHLAYVKERRTEEEAETLLGDALQQLRERRGQD